MKRIAATARKSDVSLTVSYPILRVISPRTGIGEITKLKGLPMKTLSRLHLLVTLIVGICMCAAVPATAQDPVPKKVPVCHCDWSASCGNMSGSGTGSGRTCEEAEEDAAAQAAIWVETNCMGEPAAISLGDLNPEFPMVRAAGDWKVEYKCWDRKGNSYAVTRSGCTFCEAYNAAQKVVRKRFPQGCCCRSRVIQRPCCCCCR